MSLCQMKTTILSERGQMSYIISTVQKYNIKGNHIIMISFCVIV